MKKLYFTFLFTLCIALGFSKNNTDDIITELGKVRHHVDAGEASFNLEDLKYHSKKALLAIKTVKGNLDIEKCEKTFEVSVRISDLLDSALISEELVEGQRYLNTSKSLITKAFYEFEICSSIDHADLALNNLEQQQTQLKQQQLELERQAAQIKKQLEEQKQKEINLKKEAYINSNEKALQKTINAYNETLKACGCNQSVTSTNTNNLASKNNSIEQIKAFYIEKMLSISQVYQSKLSACKN